MVEQETIQLCVLGKALAEDADFLDICRGFKVFSPLFSRFKVKYSESYVGLQVPVLTSEDGAGLIGKGEEGVTTIFVHQDFSGDKSYDSFT